MTQVAHAPTILVADGTPVARDLLVRVLRSEGFQTLAAGDWTSVLKQCASGRADLILLDPALPERGELNFCSALKSQPAAADTPVIFLSAADDPQSRVDGFAAGCVDYISKPFFAREVLARVRVHLRLRQATEFMLRRESERFEELRQAQQSMLVAPEEFPQASFAVYYRALESVGGDFYDVLPLSGGAIGYFVADVSGHGVGASFLTAAVKTLLRQYSGPLFAVEDTMRQMNSALRDTLHDGRYLTALYARLDSSRRDLTVVNAGHSPLIVLSGGEARLAKTESDPLGVFGSVVFQKQEMRVGPGDRFYLYTDGLVEDPRLPGAGRAIGIERLRQASERHSELGLDEAVRAMVKELKPDMAAISDDLLLLGVEVPR
jgi:sigma-B regulation protein RsbU (phosphoserine phosphatase)